MNQLTVWTDALGCHGTSGSGFLQQDPSSGAWELLGPTALGGNAFGGLLCEHLPGVGSQPTPTPGGQHLGYSSLIQTRAMLSSSTAAWTADCAPQPVGWFSLGGRTACARAQSTLPFSPRAAYRDLDPWAAPVLQLGAAATSIGSVELLAGRRYRLALGLTPAATCSAEPCPEVAVRIGGAEVLRATLRGSAGQTALLGALFTAASSGPQSVSVVTPSGSFELGMLEVAPNSGSNSFDTGYGRAEAALMVPSADLRKTLPMRFVGDGAQGFAALLYPGERMLLVRPAAALQGSFGLRFSSGSSAALTCGLLDQNGTVLTSAPCVAGVSTTLSVNNGAAAAALFIEGAADGGVEIDNVALSMDQPTTSPCSDGIKNGNETDVDCGGTCSADCAVGKTCSVAADCVSSLCTGGVCVAAPSCTDAIKNGSETDVDCGGSCSADCGVGKTCSVAADCISNLCTAGKCVAAPSCTDAIKNGSETDVDCGGSCSVDCAVGKTCSIAADCISNLCTAGKCVAAPTSNVVATLTFSSQWDVGYCANVSVTNKSAATISSWTTVVNLAQSTTTSAWSANFTTSGSTMTARSLSWNGQLAPNAGTTFGFCANKNGSSWQPSVLSVATP